MTRAEWNAWHAYRAEGGRLEPAEWARLVVATAPYTDAQGNTYPATPAPTINPFPVSDVALTPPAPDYTPPPRAAEDFEAIGRRLAEIEREKERG